jgi:Flp pilus assembly protein TadG
MLVIGRGRTRRRPRRDRQGGGAAVEFAIVMPIFCAILFGMIDFGWYYYQRFSLTAAIRDGVRYGVTMTTAADLPWTTAKARAIADLAGGSVPTGGITWGPTVHTSGSVPTQTMTLTASMPFTPLVGFVPMPATLSSSMTMLLELQ